jgi:ABC-type nickel/cobalt efflux system permease component RcnA
VLVFALSQGVLWAGVAAVFLMGLGTFVTVAALATIAVTAKSVAQKILGRRAGAGTALVWWAELAGAFVVFGFGVLLVVASF